ncbi:CO dehydrogenase/acetyl-CoA synthase complex subunit epsilon [Candidatus Bathyarchaeota archaeon]|jgi:anaerobic carbon-monoxide dehydrogenase, CODH/ACS complex subunit epsilon|nr:CO dehydrogenase/acetyl-CoA synthase complex subunit epsilon [Candidatus Bathyarchaeota archaeon]MBT4319109.1 CO dehydrogenase/acetyl-CoA synthase complex subunit epsilon [Candidatus Bathyarchaeota archaeon]MBT4423469.1 CO dehydrogenase/acetyl-CoA synthase complex subunit epsilon [Candidatus Bathyarchaeota archaeon]MBT5642763.1 CO dehydrogenase/acetyl-CoA synthase complex subunit epsilon [Candidatus Bathyarchaeota archaeon]MBT6605419.1 CO dehydrogenase/acetyl-CoA synthase complex subunit eps
MSAKTRLGQTAEIAGPTNANIFPNGNVAASLISKAKRPLLVVGSHSVKVQTNDGDLIDSTIRAMKNSKVAVVATAHMVGEFKKRGADQANSLSLFVLGKYLSDPEWMGFDGKGPYDAVVFMGFAYYMEWLVESGLKNFAMSLRTISLDRNYQPNAKWSLGWMPEPDWKESIEIIVSRLEEEA